MTDGGKHWDDARDDELTLDELAFDEELSERLRASFEVAGPSEEAMDRMLANLLAAQEERAGGNDAEEVSAQPSGGATVKMDRFEIPDADPDSEGLTLIEGGRHMRRKASRKRYVGLGLAVAASIAVAFIGLTMASKLASPSYDATATSEMSVQEVAVSEKSDSAGSSSSLEEAPSDELDESYAAQDVATEEPATDAEIEEVGEVPNEDELLASGGAFDATSDPSYRLACTYQLIYLDTGEMMRVEEHYGGPVMIDPKWVEDLVGEASAASIEDESYLVPCWVYRLPVSDDGLYVVQYLEGGAYYAARVIDGSSYAF